MSTWLTAFVINDARMKARQRSPQETYAADGNLPKDSLTGNTTLACLA